MAVSLWGVRCALGMWGYVLGSLRNSAGLVAQHRCVSAIDPSSRRWIWVFHGDLRCRRIKHNSPGTADGAGAVW